MDFSFSFKKKIRNSIQPTRQWEPILGRNATPQWTGLRRCVQTVGQEKTPVLPKEPALPRTNPNDSGRKIVPRVQPPSVVPTTRSSSRQRERVSESVAAIRGMGITAHNEFTTDDINNNTIDRVDWD
jgi:hypothetical protein